MLLLPLYSSLILLQRLHEQLQPGRCRLPMERERLPQIRILLIYKLWRVGTYQQMGYCLLAATPAQQQVARIMLLRLLTAIPCMVRQIYWFLTDLTVHMSMPILATHQAPTICRRAQIRQSAVFPRASLAEKISLSQETSLII